MKTKYLALSAALLAGVAFGALRTCGQNDSTVTSVEAGFAFALDPDGAKAFVAQAESELMKMGEYASRASWVMANFITEDTQWLQARASAVF